MTSVEQHIIDEIIAENEQRLKTLRADFDPITGENAPGERRVLCIEDFPIPVQNVPVQMLEDPFVKEIYRCGSISRFLETTKDFDDCEDKPTVDDIIMLLFRIRFSEDFPFWSYYEIRIEDKVTGRMVPFKLNGPQIIVLNECEKMRRAGEPINLIICKARQWGGSTFCIFYQMWIGLFLSLIHI